MSWPGIIWVGLVWYGAGEVWLVSLTGGGLVWFGLVLHVWVEVGLIA